MTDWIKIKIRISKEHPLKDTKQIAEYCVVIYDFLTRFDWYMNSSLEDWQMTDPTPERG